MTGPFLYFILHIQSVTRTTSSFLFLSHHLLLLPPQDGDEWEGFCTPLTGTDYDTENRFTTRREGEGEEEEQKLTQLHFE